MLDVEVFSSLGVALSQQLYTSPNKAKRRRVKSLAKETEVRLHKDKCYLCFFVTLSYKVTYLAIQTKRPPNTTQMQVILSHMSGHFTISNSATYITNPRLTGYRSSR